jgi:hypothetical protein
MTLTWFTFYDVRAADDHPDGEVASEEQHDDEQPLDEVRVGYLYSLS